MLESLRRRASEEMAHVRGLSAEESAVLALLQRRLAEEEAQDRSHRAKARPASDAARRRHGRGRNRLDLDTLAHRSYA